MAQTKPKAAQFYGVSGDGTAGQVLISDGNGGMFWGANTENYTVSWATPTGQSLTYTQPSPQSSSGAPGTTFPTTTFTATKSGEEISGTATIAGLPTGITATQSISGTGADNILTVTLAGVFPGADSLNTALTLSGLTVAPPLTVDYLVVAGGGAGGGTYLGPGGGAGGLRTSYPNSSSLDGHTETSLSLTAATNYTVTVGAGGAGTFHTGGGENAAGNNGYASIFSTITSTAGGGSGAYMGGSNPGKSGGSGGGAAYDNGSVGAAVTSPVTQGYAGGANGGPGTYHGGGGGGANSAGSSTGVGGDGLAVNILSSANAGTAAVGEVSGSNVYYAGGGGGAGVSFGAAGGIGGGGDGDTGQGYAGIQNTGGGGGGSERNNPSAQFFYGGDGGSGVVILRYPSGYAVTVGSGIIEASGSPFTESTEKVSVFTGGTGNIQFN
jgi:hypothetical protein